MTKFSNDFSRDNWISKYQAPQDKTIDDTFRRVARDLASVEEDPNKWEEKFFEVMEGFKFIPGGRILSNAGTGLSGTTYINCFVDGFKDVDQDSIQGIYEALKRQAKILKSEGGYGFCCSIMRPNGSHITGIANQSPGSVKFLELWDKSSEIITAGSDKKSRKDQKKFIRKGAQMVTTFCWHPDVIEFIEAKQTPGRLTKFNMSVLCTDDFMEAVQKNKSWNLEFPNYEKYSKQYKKSWDGNLKKWKSLIKQDDSTIIYETYNARDLWDIIMKSTYNRNEPGVLFVDTMNNMNNLWYNEYIDATNPCGEQILPRDGVCLLGSINLTQFIDGNNWDFDKLKEIIPVVVRLMDNVNDKTKVPLTTQKQNLQDKRRIGMGVIGYGSALMMMKVRYGSRKAIRMTEELMSFIANTAYSSSALLAKEKGEFPLFDKKQFLKSHFIKVLDDNTIKLINKYGIRNSHLLSIQPTGNTSVTANLVSSGLEPLFSFGYYRTFIINRPSGLSVPKNIDWDTRSFDCDKKWTWIKEGDENILKTNFENQVFKFDRNRGLTQEKWVEDYSVTHLKEKEEWDENASYAANIFNLNTEDHIKTMTVFAKYIDSAISKTINLPNSYDYEDFKNIYMKAWKNGIKGFTTYREGTMTNVLSVSSSDDDSDSIPETKAPQRPRELSCDVFNISVQTQPYFVLVGKMGDKPYEIFAGRAISEIKKCECGKIVKYDKPKGYKAILDHNVELFPLHALSNDTEEALTRMISTSLRHGANINFVVEQLEKVEGNMTTFAKAIARALKKYIPDGTSSGDCPECKSNLIRIDGCKSCKDCGYTACT